MLLISAVFPEHVLVGSNISGKGWLKICGYISYDILFYILHD